MSSASATWPSSSTSPSGSGLLGRGGAAFPVATKLRAMPRGTGTHVLVNGSESEPASQKDRTLMRLAPHLVLDGALAVARALGTGTGHRRRARPWSRGRAGVPRSASAATPQACGWWLSTGGFVSGEVRAVIRGLDGGPAVPPGRRVLPHEHGIGGAPTFASNVETFAQLALLILAGRGRVRRRSAQPTSRAPRCSPWSATSPPGSRGGADRPAPGRPAPGQDTEPRPVLVGGYHGSWVTRRPRPDGRPTRPASGGRRRSTPV